MIEVGTVHKIDKKNRATIRFSRKTACENCRMCLKSKDKMYVELKIENTLNAKEGDRVKVSMGNQFLLLSSAIVYLLPVALAGASAIFTRGLDNVIGFSVAMGVLVIGFVIVAIIDKIVRKNKKYIPSMVEIIKEEERENGK